MRKQAIARGLRGFPVGISIGYAITILTSFLWGQGEYWPCVPALVKTMGNELNAVLVQVILCGLIGAVCAAGSVVWEIERWSIARQTAVYFAGTAIVMMPIAYWANWMDHTAAGVLVYFGLFVAIFAVLWLVQFLIWKQRIRKLNAQIERDQQSG